MGQFSLKELNDVKLKATYPMKLGERDVEVGEIIAVFDKIDIANFKEITRQYAATGGYGNQERVFWNTTEALNLTFSQGVFSKEQLALMLNANMVSQKKQEIILSEREYTQSDSEGKIVLKNNPISLFIYLENGEKIKPIKIENNHVFIEQKLERVIIDYEYSYVSPYELLQIGKELAKGYLSLEGKTKIKDDVTGQITTGILKIPKLRITSNLSMTLGKNASPIVGTFDGVAYPSGTRNNSHVMDFYFLSNDIDSDI